MVKIIKRYRLADETEITMSAGLGGPPSSSET